MKKIISTLIILIGFNLYSQDYYFITAENGLNVRTESNLSSNKIAKLPFGFLVKKTAETNKSLSITDNGKQITGTWVKIEFYNSPYLVSEQPEQHQNEGYVFDGYMEPLKKENTITNIKIDSLTYSELLKKADKTIYKHKKISDLDSIKTVLKHRVEWIDYETYNSIKSIITNNGKKLITNIESNDFGFAEDWSGYYPEFDILVLEGGHSSDMCFSIKTGETTKTIGNPEYIIPSPKGTYRLNGYFGGQECISYFFQKKENKRYKYLTKFNWDYDICTFKTFYWINETEFIYTKMNYQTDSKNGTKEFFKGKIL
ncbi:MAG: SH3 domain-containing protein [Aestuariibaculum sp.]